MQIYRDYEDGTLQNLAADMLNQLNAHWQSMPQSSIPQNYSATRPPTNADLLGGQFQPQLGTMFNRSIGIGLNIGIFSQYSIGIGIGCKIWYWCITNV